LTARLGGAREGRTRREGDCSESLAHKQLKWVVEVLCMAYVKGIEKRVNEGDEVLAGEGARQKVKQLTQRR